MRVGYRLDLKNRRTLDLFGEIVNVTNRDNFANPTGDQANANFLRLTGLSTSTQPRPARSGSAWAFRKLRLKQSRQLVSIPNLQLPTPKSFGNGALAVGS